MTSGRRQYLSPFDGLVDMVHDMGRMRETMHRGQSENRRESEGRSHVDAWIPDVDIAATDDQLVICADLAGIADEDVSVTYSPPTLTIAGQRRSPDLDGSGRDVTYFTQEVARGHFRRSITLPEGCARDDITVALSRGLLTITVQQQDRGDPSSALPVTSDDT